MNITVEVHEGEVLLDHISISQESEVIRAYVDCRTKYPDLLSYSELEFVLEPRQRFDGQHRGPEGEFTIITFEGIPEDYQMWYEIGKYSLQILWLPKALGDGTRIWEADERYQ